MAKQLAFSEDARRHLQRGVDAVAEAVVTTLGPKGRNVALDRKFAALRSLRPDVAVISECAEPARLEAKLGLARRGVDLVWVGCNPHKGLAVMGFRGHRLSLLPEHDPALEFIAPVRVDASRVEYWMGQGAKQSERVADLLKQSRGAAAAA